MRKEEKEEVDGRTFNFRKNSSLFHKLRILNPGNKCGESFGITIPKPIAENFIGCWMQISISGNSIILQSGCRITEQNNFEKELEKFNDKQNLLVIG